MKHLRAIILALTMTATAWAADLSYVGAVAQPEGAADWRYSLVLRDNGNAVLRTAKTSRNNSIENAVWTKTEAGDISLQFLNREGRPRGMPLIWKESGSNLTPVTWDKTGWGEGAPPKMRRG